MYLKSRHVKALLRDKKLKELLLCNDEFTVKEYEDFDNLSIEKSDIVVENIVDILEAFAPFNRHYSSPVEQFPDDAVIYGTKGIYVLINQAGTVFFSNKKDVLKYAGDLSNASWDVAKSSGWFP